MPTDRISAYPPFVGSDEERRRWRLVTVAGLASYGIHVGDSLDRDDRALIWRLQRTLFASDLATGEGDVLPAQEAWLQQLGLI